MRAIVILSLLFLLVLAAAQPAAGTCAQLCGPVLTWFTIAPGGSSSGGPYGLLGVIGQADAGRLSGGGYTLEGGFLSGTTGDAWYVYLPLTSR